VFAHGRVQAGICQSKPFYRLAANDVGFDDLFDICLGDVPVPDCVGVNDEVGAMFALVEAAGLIGTYFPFQSALGQFLFEEFLQFGFR